MDDQTRTRESVVRFFGDQVPGKHSSPGGRDGGLEPRPPLVRWWSARNGPGARLADQAASTSTRRTWARPALLIRLALLGCGPLAAAKIIGETAGIDRFNFCEEVSSKCVA